MSTNVVPLSAYRAASGPVPHPPAASAAGDDCPTCLARALLARVTTQVYAHQDTSALLVASSEVADELARVRDDLAAVLSRVDAINRGYSAADHTAGAHQ